MKLIVIFFQVVCRLELINTRNYCKKYTVVSTSTLDSFFRDANNFLVASDKLTATVIFMMPTFSQFNHPNFNLFSSPTSGS